VLAVNHARELEDLQTQAAAMNINDKYKEELQAQIASNEELKKKERQVRGAVSCLVGINQWWCGKISQRFSCGQKDLSLDECLSLA